jgi:hypothetical protein
MMERAMRWMWEWVRTECGTTWMHAASFDTEVINLGYNCVYETMRF